MWSHERQARILEMLAERRKVSSVGVSELLGVSRETVRRDLLEMEQAGLLMRVHGGALPAPAEVAPEAAFAERIAERASEKAAIGRKACELVPRGATCFVDAGTTTAAFARCLADRGDIRVITNSIEIARTLADAPDCDVLLLGGRPHRDVPATYGEMTLSEIDRFLADFAILSPVALHPERGATDYELREAEVARGMIRRSQSCVMLCHAEKIGAESRVAICRLDEIDHLVTDAPPGSIALPRGRAHFVRRLTD